MSSSKVTTATRDSTTTATAADGKQTWNTTISGNPGGSWNGSSVTTQTGHHATARKIGYSPDRQVCAFRQPHL